jgi:hypothetical protein
MSNLQSTLNEWNRAYSPSSPIERDLIDHALQAQRDRDECLRIRATLRAETLRTADRYWDEAQEDEVARLRRMFNVSPYRAMVGLKRSAAGCRFLIARWEHLEKSLAEHGTWYGAERIEAIQLQGLSALVDDLYLDEDAYMTWVHCLAAQPNPKQRDIDLILARDVMPKSIQDRDLEVWPRDPAESRRALAAIVARELPALRVREELLRVRYEEPARAEAKEQALARLAVRTEEIALLRAQRSHEQAYQRATRALLQARAALARAAVRQVIQDESKLAPTRFEQSRQGAACQPSPATSPRGYDIP